MKKKRAKEIYKLKTQNRDLKKQNDEISVQNKNLKKQNDEITVQYKKQKEQNDFDDNTIAAAFFRGLEAMEKEKQTKKRIDLFSLGKNANKSNKFEK